MKKWIVLMTMCVLTSAGFAQRDSIGVYVTAKDFSSRNLTSKTASLEGRILAEGVVNAKTITLKSKGKKTRFEKSMLYGFRSEKGDFRIVDNDSYRILNTDKFFLYTRTIVKQGKGMVSETKYYFSTDAQGSIQELTVSNLKQAFPKDTLFHDELDFRIREERDLITYNVYHKQYRVIHLYSEAMIVQAGAAKL